MKYREKGLPKIAKMATVHGVSLTIHARHGAVNSHQMATPQKTNFRIPILGTIIAENCLWRARMMKTISIANDFSVFPGGRTPEDGPYSGQEFRDNFLMPLFEKDEEAMIDFDNVRGYGSSFLEETFGGLIRKGISKGKVKKILRFHSKKPSIIEEINQYIDDAAEKQNV